MQHQEEHRRHKDAPEEDVSAEAEAQPPASASKASSDTDELIDEIDDLIREIDAKKFVAEYVQKPGQ